MEWGCNMKKQILLVIICMICIGIFFLDGRKAYTYYRYNNEKLLTRADIDKIDLNGYNKLMMVAHPDDETLWGGAHLLKDDYLVVCFSNKSNEAREKEFSKAMDFSNDKYIMLDYPDKILGKISDWSKIEEYLKADIKTLVEYKDWDCIVTHNKDGEYGHQHHKSVSKFTTEVCEKSKLTNKLKYFGKYYTRKTINNNRGKLIPISKEALDKKVEMLSIYKSQAFIKNSHGHMYGYEFGF